MTWSALKTIGSSTNRMVNGAWIWVVVGVLPQMTGMNSEPTASSWARPMVATVRIRRGALKKRRMMASSTTLPSTTAASSPRATAKK